MMCTYMSEANGKNGGDIGTQLRPGQAVHAMPISHLLQGGHQQGLAQTGVQFDSVAGST